MNAFFEHHKNNIRFAYRCLDRILLNAVIQPFQQPERVIGFFWTYRRLYPVSRQVLREIANQYHHWVLNRSQKWQVEIQKDPEDRRDDFLAPCFRKAEPDQVVAIIKAREPARIMTAIGKDQNWHLQIKSRWVDQYNFYLNDRHWGPMFVRLCPYFPFSARVCLNQHHWLARHMRQRGISFQQCTNAFLRCSDPQCSNWPIPLRPTICLPAGRNGWPVSHLSSPPRSENMLQFSIVCFLPRLNTATTSSSIVAPRSMPSNNGSSMPIAPLVNRTNSPSSSAAGSPAIITASCRPSSKISTFPTPSSAAPTSTDSSNSMSAIAASCVLNQPPTMSLITALAKRWRTSPSCERNSTPLIDRYLELQQDILETFVDRGQLRKLTQPTLLPNGKRVPGLKLDHPRQLAVMRSLVRFCYLAAGGIFTTADLYPHVLQVLGLSAADYQLSSLRYDLWKLRAKGLVEKIPHARRYQLLPHGYQICLLFLKLLEKIYAPLTAGILQPFAADNCVPIEKTTSIDRRYLAVVKALDNLVEAVGLKTA